MPKLNLEKVLHYHPEWCRITLASIGEAVITTDREGRVTFVNPIAESLTGWTQDEAASIALESVFRIVDRDTRETVESPAVRALRVGMIVGLASHTMLIAKDGREFSLDGTAAPIRNDMGEVVGVALVFRNVTDRCRQEQALQDGLCDADSIVATLREPFLVLERDLRVVTANRSFYQDFHVTPEETQGHFVYDLGNRQWDIRRLRKRLEEVLSQNHTFQVFAVEHEFPIIGRKTMLLNARRIPNLGNHSERILLAIEDVTDRSRAEASVLHSEVRYRRLFETAKDGILILNTDSGRITDANPFMSTLLGYSHANFLNKELWQIGLFSEKAANEAAFRELREKGYIRYDHLPLESDRGKRVEVEVVANVYHEEHQSVIQCNIRDITERSRLERTTREQAEALADQHRRKDEFLAMLSHELRGPLAPIASAVQLLRLQKNEGELQQQACSMIERQVGKLTRLVDDLLEVSRTLTGKIHLQLERIALNGIVENGVETARTLIEQRRHVLELSLPSQPIWLFADAARLEQVVVNLVTNAAKYTADGGQILVSVQQEGDEAVLRVRDTGVGIAPELLPRIFDLFTQAERSLDRSQGGLGIGLCLVQRLVEMHRGKVEASSELGQGSEFVVRLPMTALPAPQPPATTTEATKPTGPSLRVLVVDDNLDAAQGSAMLLKALGHDVRTACDGPTALEAALDYRPNLVLLDIGLPGLDGFEVAKRLRQQSVLRSVVLVAVTGYGQKSDRHRSQEAGFDHHLTKPANFGRLKQILATVLT